MNSQALAYARLLFPSRQNDALCLAAELSVPSWPGFENAVGQPASALLPEDWLSHDVFAWHAHRLLLLGSVAPAPGGALSVTLINTGGLLEDRLRQEVDEFAYKASHDLQEPLRKINAFGERLSATCQSQLQGDGALFIERMQAAAARMQAMLDGLLDYSRAANPVHEHPYPSLEEAARTAWQTIRPQTHQATLDLLPHSLPRAATLASALHQVFLLLFQNAVKFKSPDRPLRVSVVATQTGGKWTIAVRDNGIGFDPVNAERIFQLFERLHGVSAYPGAGMGLAIARKRISALGGALWADGRENEGATFFIDLPTLTATENNP
ncbi:MAG: ATP-binding protein [Saprospiraceae bacterium]|nr:ATP-binding protein [Saprospiraceae bacterium]